MIFLWLLFGAAGYMVALFLLHVFGVQWDSGFEEGDE